MYVCMYVCIYIYNNYVYICIYIYIYIIYTILHVYFVHFAPGAGGVRTSSLWISSPTLYNTEPPRHLGIQLAAVNQGFVALFVCLLGCSQ